MKNIIYSKCDIVDEWNIFCHFECLINQIEISLNLLYRGGLRFISEKKTKNLNTSPPLPLNQPDSPTLNSHLYKYSLGLLNIEVKSFSNNTLRF